MTRVAMRHRGLALAGAAMLGFAAIAGGVSAHGAHGHPTLIHEGTCDNLGKVAYTLNGVGASVDEAGTPVATAEAVNPKGSYQMLVGESKVAAKLDDLLAKPLALMVYDNDEDMQGIACGNLGGARLGDELIVGLAEVNVPGHTGYAQFAADGDETDVTVIVGHGLSPVSAGGAGGHGGADGHTDGHAEDGGMEMATPAASS